MAKVKVLAPHRGQRAAFVVNTDRGFLTHRASWATELIKRGYSVRVYAPDSGYSRQIEDMGIEFRDFSLGRESIQVRRAVIAALTLLVSLLAYRPKTVFLVQTAAYALGWPAAILLPRTTFVRVAGGIGRAMTAGRSRGRLVMFALLRAGGALPNVRSLFQTTGDKNWFVGRKLARESRCAVVPGTGIDTSVWYPTEEKPRPLIVLFASRLYEEKGVRQFVQIARKNQDLDVRFVIVGEPDMGVSSAIPTAEIEQWVDEGAVEWWGHADEMLPIFRSAALLVFPSRHPEGTPRTLIEAGACGIPMIVSDQEGCREVVEDGSSGWVVNALDVDYMGRRVRELVNDGELRARFANRSRSIVESKFSSTVVIPAILEFARVA